LQYLYNDITPRWQVFSLLPSQKTNIMLKKMFYVASLALIISSCAKDVLETEETVENEIQQVELNDSVKDSLKAQFARVLSSVVYENEDVREFLKTEAVKQFDKNYDVLYVSVKDKQIGGRAFRDFLVRESSEDFIREVENGIPLLNILFPNLPMFNLSPEQYDSKDDELPVAVVRRKCNELYFNGKCTDRLEKGQIPGFHTLVVNENTRVIVNNDTRRGISSFIFKSPNYDGNRKNDGFATRSTLVPTSIIGGKAATAYMYFYADDSSIYSKALQRDYIYYGMSPTCQTGTLNQSINEYLSFIEVDPNVYFSVTDDIHPISPNPSDDPYIKANSVSKTHTDFTEQELIDALWTSGAYNFRFEVQTSSYSSPQILYIPLRPEQLWDFNLTRTYQHETWFTPKKYTYTINPADFTAKQHKLFSERIALGKWNIKTESLYRYISILEEDNGTTSTTSYSYESAIAHSDKFSDSGKIVLGLGNSSVQGNIATEVTDSNSTRTIKNATVTRVESSDHLGSVRVYFYDPIADYSELETSLMYTYNTGCVKFGITASL